MRWLLAPPPVAALWIYLLVLFPVAVLVAMVISLERELRAVKAKGDRRTTIGRRLSDAAVFTLHPLLGADGRLSYSKLTGVAVLGSYAISSNLPAVVACWLIAASFGSKVLLAVIAKTDLTATSATELKAAVSESFSKEEKLTGQLPTPRTLASGDRVVVHPLSSGATKPGELGDDPTLNIDSAALAGHANTEATS
jgi:hypothetical protein